MTEAGLQRCFCRFSFLFLSCVVPFGTCVLYSSRLSCCIVLQLAPLLMASKRMANRPPAPADQRAQGLLQMHHRRRHLLQLTVTAAMIFTFMVADAMMAGTALSFVKAVIAKTIFSMICWSTV
jgi:hypothetical protein